MLILPHWPDFPWESVEEVDRGFSTDCWMWTSPWREGATTTRRDGSVYKPSITGHRTVRRLLVVAVGVPDRDQHEVWMHLCELHGETNLCVRPDHIKISRKGENNKDRMALERRAGWDHSTAKLSAVQVEEIRRRYLGGGVTQRQLAKEYGVAQPTISNLTKGITWGDKSPGLPSPAEESAVEDS